MSARECASRPFFLARPRARLIPAPSRGLREITALAVFADAQKWSLVTF